MYSVFGLKLQGFTLFSLWILFNGAPVRSRTGIAVFAGLGPIH